MLERSNTCREIQRLREEAKLLQERLRTSQQRAREHSNVERRSDGRGRSSNDFEQFLQRKILKTSFQIAQHIAEHGCEELGKSQQS